MPKNLPEREKMDDIRHSLSHLLAASVLKKFPDAKLGIGPTIENGFYYDFLLPRGLTPEDLGGVEKEMRSMIQNGLAFKGEKTAPTKAKKLFENQPFKLELINEFVKGKKPLTVYYTGSNFETNNLKLITSDYFIDLCRGGHVKNTKEINPDAFKLTHTAGAYWRGDSQKPQLQRIYGVAFETKDELNDFLRREEEAKKRDHRVLGEKLKLFTFAEEVGPGLPLWLPKGTIIREEIEKKAKEVEGAWSYERVATPHIAKEELYVKSGHIPYYKESMYPPMKLDDGNYYLKAMNCPHTHMIYLSEPRSYRELPIRYAEFGTVYRYELSGTLAGLLRVRGFTQNDAHIYCREDQAEEEFLKVMKLHEFWYKNVFGINDFYMRLSLPSKSKTKFAGIPKEWSKAVAIVRRAMKKSGLKYEEAEGEASFYGPKIDFQIKSVIGREETASTNQLDFLAAKRFNLVYTDKNGKQKPVYVIHRAPLGSHERFIAFLIEHYAGAFPLWLSPVQIKILTVTNRSDKYAGQVADELKNVGLRTESDTRNESMGKKIREAEMEKIPYIAIVGDKEEQNKTVSVRARGKGDLGEKNLGQFKDELLQGASGLK